MFLLPAREKGTQRRSAQNKNHMWNFSHSSGGARKDFLAVTGAKINETELFFVFVSLLFENLRRRPDKTSVNNDEIYAP